MAMGINDFSVAAQWRPLAEALLQATASPAAILVASMHASQSLSYSVSLPCSVILHCCPDALNNMSEASAAMVFPP